MFACQKFDQYIFRSRLGSKLMTSPWKSSSRKLFRRPTEDVVAAAKVFIGSKHWSGEQQLVADVLSRAPLSCQTAIECLKG